MPFGLKMSQNIFQKKIDQTYEKCKGAVGIANDIQVLAVTRLMTSKPWKGLERQVSNSTMINAL